MLNRLNDKPAWALLRRGHTPFSEKEGKVEEIEVFELTEGVPDTWQVSQCRRLRNDGTNVMKIKVGLGG